MTPPVVPAVAQILNCTALKARPPSRPLLGASFYREEYDFIWLFAQTGRLS